MQKKLYIPIMIILIGLFRFAGAQTDTSFWFGVPNFDPTYADEPIRLVLCPTVGGTKVVIDVPANPSFVPITINLVANECEVVDLSTFKGILEADPANSILDRGIRILADNNISAYFELANLNEESSDYFTCKGRVALGTEYIIPGQNLWQVDQSVGSDVHHGFVIVATENSTTVQITPKVNLVGHPAGLPFTVTLNAGQVWSGVSTSAGANGSPVGTMITSNREIAVTNYTDAGSNPALGTCQDLMGDQLLPTTSIDLEYILVKGSLGTPNSRYECQAGSKGGSGKGQSNISPYPDKVFITALFNSTVVTIDGNTNIVVNKGQTQVVNLNDPSMHILASAPIYVYQATGNGCESAASVVPPLRCSGMTNSLIYRNTEEDMYLMLIVPQGGENGFRINGNSALVQSNAFSPVPGTNGKWMAARVLLGNKGANGVQPGKTSVIENIDGEKFRMGLIHGCALNTASFAYFADYYKVVNDPIYHY
ncbi:MAG: IgGFc-binding protein [Bacteroidota bacterium]|nr:IgGFc-binding protein [Bacteroidota bacterium]